MNFRQREKYKRRVMFEQREPFQHESRDVIPALIGALILIGIFLWSAGWTYLRYAECRRTTDAAWWYCMGQ